MKVGDLVRFNATMLFSAAQLRYPKCGVVVDVREGTFEEATGIKTQGSVRVMWADGNYSREWLCYVEVINESR